MQLAILSNIFEIMVVRLIMIQLIANWRINTFLKFLTIKQTKKSTTCKSGSITYAIQISLQ